MPLCYNSQFVGTTLATSTPLGASVTLPFTTESTAAQKEKFPVLLLPSLLFCRTVVGANVSPK